MDADLTPQTGEDGGLDATERIAGGLPRPQPLRDPDHRAHKAALAEALFGAPRQVVRVGRFRVVERLGEGGMGVVYLGHDDELDRRVAIKVLRGDGGLAEDDVRLLREAQALARLSHPNVVGLFEVGQHEGALFVAMEHVRGRTLHAWLHAGPRPWREVLDVFLAAGRGLAAAHAVGLVHRDFKPGNVMLGDDGRVRVLDFGLAREQAALAGPRPATDVAAMSALASPLTLTGGVVGTPAYMAPEQLYGQRSDPRSDQFSFCVALFEALHGARPFAGATHGEIFAAIERGEIRRGPNAANVPKWLHTIVVRGLAKDPDARWPTMSALLAELTRDRQARRRRFTLAAVIAALGALPLGMGVSAGLEAHTHSSRKAACEAASADISEVWNLGERARIFTRLGPGASPQVLDGAADAATSLQYAAESWVDDRVELCMSDGEGYVHPQFRRERLERAERCFAEDLARVRNGVAIAQKAAPEQLRHLPRTAGALRRTCVAASELPGRGSDYPEDPGAQRLWGEIQGEVAHARLELAAGQPLAAAARLVPAVAQARALKVNALTIEALRLLTRARFAAGQRRDAWASLEAGLTVSGELLSHRHAEMFESLTLEVALGAVTGKPRHAAARMLGRGNDRLTLREIDDLGGLAEEMVQPFWRKDWPTLSGWVARASLPALLASARLLAGLADFERAEDYARAGLAIVGFNPPNPGLTVDLLLVLAEARQGLGRPPHAAEALQQALALADAADADPVARLRLPQVRLALADLALARADVDGAARELLAAQQLAEAAEVDDDRFVPALTLLLARLHAARGDLAGARPLIDRSRVALAGSHGVTRRMLVGAELEDGRQALARGEFELASTTLAAALRQNEALVGADHPSHAAILAVLARAQQANGHDGVAAATRARGRALIAGRVVDPALRAALGE